MSSRGYGVRGAAIKFLLLAALLCTGVQTAEAAEKRLLLLGDSLTAGYGLPAEDGFAAQLQRALTERGHDVRVLNAGVSGDTSAGGLARLDWSLAEKTWMRSSRACRRPAPRFCWLACGRRAISAPNTGRLSKAPTGGWRKSTELRSTRFS